MTNTLDAHDMSGSLFAQDVQSADGAQAQIPIAKVATRDARSRAWRVTLSRLDRNDAAAPLTITDPGNSSPLFLNQLYRFAAGFQNTPQVPPRRSNPIYGTAAPASQSDIDPVFVQIAWGMSTGKRNYMVAHWPAQGASIVVEGSFVEVYGGTFASTQSGTPPPTIGEFPRLAAAVAPVDGLASEDAGELSIQQRINVFPFEGAPATLSADGVAVPTSGFVAAGIHYAMPCSAAYGAGPFSGWNGTIVRRGSPFGPSRSLVIFTANNAPQFELRDNQIPNGAGAFVASPGNVGIVYRSNGVLGVKTVADLEALVDTSALVQMGSPSANQPFEVFAGFSNAVNYAPAITGQAIGTLGDPTQGGAVYVPDFARRVKVNLCATDTRFVGNELRVPLTGPPPSQLVWYDDLGNVVDTEFQGVATGGAVIAPIVWHAVPARAVMLGVYGDPAVSQDALVHWRLAP